jgi:ankyrin repeat protein
LISLISDPNVPVRTILTDESGAFRFEGVKPGTYSVSAETEHFTKTIVENLSVGESAEIQANISMEVSGISVTVGAIAIVEFDGALANAVANDDIEGAKELIARGENVNRKEPDGTTALHVAVENGNLEMVELLLNFGAKVNARTDEKRTPLMYLDEDTSADLVRTLIRYGANVDRIAKNGDTALIVAARDSNAAVVQALVDAGAKLDVQDNDGMTALMEAAYGDDLEKARILILAGADVNLTDKDGETACNKTSDEELEKLLETYGAVVDGVD